MVAKMAGTVMNGPVPTMFDMLMETALRSPRLRGSRACSAPDRAAGVLEVAVKSEPILWIFQSEYCNSLKITQEFSDFPKRLDQRTISSYVAGIVLYFGAPDSLSPVKGWGRCHGGA